LEKATTRKNEQPSDSRIPARPSSSAQLRSAYPLAGLQRTLGNQAVLQLMESGGIQAKLRVSQPGDADEQEADRIADQIVSAKHVPIIQRKCACSGGTPCSKCAHNDDEEVIHRQIATPLLRSSALSVQRSAIEATEKQPDPLVEERSAEPGTPPKQQVTPPASRSVPRRSRLIVEDDASKLDPGQIRRSQFIEQLRTDVTATANTVLATVGRNTESCPYIPQWLAFYAAQDSQHLESAVVKYAPEAARATRAQEYLSIVNARVLRAVTAWAKTGKITGVPPEVPFTPHEPGAHKKEDSASSGSPNLIARTKESGSTTSSTSTSTKQMVQSKGRNGHTTETADAEAVQSRLGAGRSLDSAVKSRMESAFGQNFSQVRVHTDGNAAGLSSELNARAFTLGHNIAFASSEYKPGTPIGDALIAHELAHVVQQQNVSSSSSIAAKRDQQYGQLENDADDSAVRAIVSLWGGFSGAVKEIGRGALPRLKSGLRLQRCESCGSQGQSSTQTPVVAGNPKDFKTYGEWLKSFPAYSGSGDSNITESAPQQLRDYIVGKLGTIPDCADVSLLLRHYYLKMRGEKFTFKAGPERKEFTIGQGIPDEQLKQCTVQLGTINFQEDRKGFSLARFLKEKKTKITNLKKLLAAGLKSGDLFVWKRKSSITGPGVNFDGHVQTIQEIDLAKGMIVVLQGNMVQGKGVGQLQQRKYTFEDLTGHADGDGDIRSADPNAEEDFFAAGPWVDAN